MGENSFFRAKNLSVSTKTLSPLFAPTVLTKVPLAGQQEMPCGKPVTLPLRDLPYFSAKDTLFEQIQ